MDIVQAVAGFEDQHLRDKFDKAVAIVTRTIDLFKPEGAALSFNGGKDSTLLLHIIRAAVAQRAAATEHADGNSTSTSLGGIHSFIFERPDDFQEILEFTEQCNQRYGLHIEIMQTDFKTGVSQLLEERPIKAIILGTRRGDPNAGDQETFCPSSAGWAPFMRVNPIMDWGYTEVWALLRGAHLPYCSLYDKGYTSIGATSNTAQNGSLQRKDGSFAPAWQLADGRLERAGRSSKPGHKPVPTPGMTLTAGLVIVGDEILSAKVPDTNTSFLCAELRAIGWRVCKVVIVPDEVAAISAEVHTASESFDIVMTTGGVGPTLDDVTMAGVADALGCPLIRDPQIEASLRGHFGSSITEHHLKLAETPQGESTITHYALDDGQQSPFPLLRCRNIYVLPGVPALVRKKWQVIKEQLLQHNDLSPFRSVTLRLSSSDETQIAPALQAVAQELTGQVSHQADRAGIVLSLESKSTEQLMAARDLLLKHLPVAVHITAEERDSSVLSRARSVQRLSTEQSRPSPASPGDC